jgi:3-oxoadipate enol-lactonase
MNSRLYQVEIAGLAETILGLRPLLDVIATPVHAPLGTNGSVAAIARMVNYVASLVGPPDLRFVHADIGNLSVLERVVSARLTPSLPSGEPTEVEQMDLAEVASITTDVLKNRFEHRFLQSFIRSFDGSELATYCGGVPESDAVLILPPCGMPAKLIEPWLECLSEEWFVVTAETRGLFGPIEDSELSNYDISSQSKDVFAVMDYFNVDRAHLFALCGGAVTALHAAAAQPERIKSLSLWHGDYELGPSHPKTNYQRHLKALMLAGRGTRKQAAMLHSLFVTAMLVNLDAGLAHHILYPYATLELFHRYCKLNGAIQEFEVTPLLPTVAAPTLIVTSEDDDTAHPEGSRLVSQKIRNAILHVEPHGDHLSLYGASPRIAEIAKKFLRRPESSFAS